MLRPGAEDERAGKRSEQHDRRQKEEARARIGQSGQDERGHQAANGDRRLPEAERKSTLRPSNHRMTARPLPD